MLIQFLGSRFGGYAVAAIILVVLGGWVWIDGLRLDAAVSDLTAARAQLDSAVTTNGRQKEAIDQLTEDWKAAKAKADKASHDLAASQARIDTRTESIIKDLKHVPSDDDPISDSERDLLVRLRSAYAPRGH
jgi:hypothetical protein